MRNLKYILLPFIIFIFASCDENFGNGGTSMISGKVLIKDGQEIKEAKNVNVYLLYMDNSPQCISLKTNRYGEYCFKGLSCEDYAIFVDELKSENDNYPVFFNAVINAENQKIKMDTIIIVEK